MPAADVLSYSATWLGRRRGNPVRARLNNLQPSDTVSPATARKGAKQVIRDDHADICESIHVPAGEIMKEAPELQCGSGASWKRAMNRRA